MAISSTSPSPAAIGARTFSTMFAPSSAALASGAISAPASAKAASGMPADRPAPVSTATKRPRPLYFLTVSGVAATRVSAGRRSFRTASRMGVPSPRRRMGARARDGKPPPRGAARRTSPARFLRADAAAAQRAGGGRGALLPDRNRRRDRHPRDAQRRRLALRHHRLGEAFDL